MSDSWIEGEVKAALDEVYRPAPWLVSTSMAAVRKSEPPRRALAWAAGAVAVLLAVSTIGIFVLMRASRVLAPRAVPAQSTQSRLPQPIPQPITRTGPGAQIAWLLIRAQGQQPYLIGVDGGGHIIGRIDQSTAPGLAGVYRTWRSADGAAIFMAGEDQLTSYSAVDGKKIRTYSRLSGVVVGDAFSPDGSWLAILVLGPELRLQVVDLQTGSSQVLPVATDPNASLPGTTCSGGCAGKVEWGMAVFGPDSSHIYTLTDWGGPLRLTAFGLEAGKLSQTATAVDGLQGRKFPSCAAPAMAAKVVGGGHTLVAFCHMDGAVWFFNLDNLTSSGVVRTHQGNPFWLSPIFTPDGQLLYLHQWPGFGDSMQVVDLTNRRLLGPVPTPTNPDQNGPFAWLITNARAGGVASTVPISPDGLKLYTGTSDGVVVMRVPDLKPVAKLAPGFNANEVWVSGDGQTIYATLAEGKSLAVMSSDGSNVKTASLPGPGGFVASEHG